MNHFHSVFSPVIGRFGSAVAVIGNDRCGRALYSIENGETCSADYRAGGPGFGTRPHF